MAGARRRSREIALRVLYGLDANPGLGPDDALRLYFDHLGGDGSTTAARDADGDDGELDDRPFTETLVRGVCERRAEIDAHIGRLSRSWRLERMAVVDRNLLRLGLYELLHLPDVPTAVTMDECIEIAKRYGAEEAGAFLNGVLERAATDLGITKSAKGGDRPPG